MRQFRTALLVLFLLIPAVAGANSAQAGSAAQELQQRADAAFDSGSWEAALSAYQELLDSDPQGPYARRSLLRMARALAALGRNDEALDRIEQFAAGGPNRAALTAMQGAAELAPLRDNDRYVAALDALTPCSAPEYRQFDFWVGSWDVYAPNGQMVGRNVIEPILDGCGLQESWTSATGSRGHSYNFYDSARGMWHQTWIDDSGNPLYLDGAIEDGRMVLGDGTNRITWTPLPTGYVRQHWEVTTDGGVTWTTAFDGEYRQAASR
jgi:tetratricopeptide (TPR) repeat protein